jgi:tetratricopeptide (TPR) repeat protein
VTNVLFAVLGAALATNQPAVVSNTTLRANALSSASRNTNDPVEQELQRLMAADDEAQADADQWIQENMAFAAKGAGVPRDELNRRIQQRFAAVGKAYEDFLQQHPNNARARVAYASFLSDTKDEEAAQEQLEKALTVETNDPAIYNNLANIYGHHGPVKKAFEYYARAIQLNPREPVYYHNFGTTVYLFRVDAMEYYGITQDQVFAKAFELYSNAMRFDPQDFPLASDIAQTYYGIQPMRTEDALRAWTNALAIAHDETEREGVYVHFARIKMMAGRFAEAQNHLNAITNDLYIDLKKRLTRNLETRERESKGTNAPASEHHAESSNPKIQTQAPQ